jgi:alkylation response protein AidB-like acyl-CoA dehydrogenase
MDLVLSEDQVALRDELRRFLAATVTPERRRAATDLPGAVDRALWAALQDMGVFALAVSESRGGLELGMTAAAIALEELGRAAVPGPLVATAVARRHGVEGDVIGLVERATPAVVEHLDALDALVIPAQHECAVVVDLITTMPAGSDRGPVVRPLDPLTPVTVVPELPGGTAIGDATVAVTIRREAALLAAAQQVGLGQAALDLAVAYAGERHQFGRPIGSFQALKHLLADAAVGIEVARAAVHAAAVTLDEGGDIAGRHSVDAARLVASEAARRATTTCIQVHGGIGYTWELDAHLFLKRVLVLDQLPDTPEHALEALSGRL